MPGILLIEDNQQILENTAEFLRLSEYTVHEATNGLEGLEQARTHHPELIISDVIMPDMNGFEMLKELKADPDTAGIPVVLITARADQESMDEALQLGAATYLTKPYSNDDLLDLVAQYVQK